jgi:hypothetical protein
MKGYSRKNKYKGAEEPKIEMRERQEDGTNKEVPMKLEKIT